MHYDILNKAINRMDRFDHILMQKANKVIESKLFASLLFRFNLVTLRSASEGAVLMNTVKIEFEE